MGAPWINQLGVELVIFSPLASVVVWELNQYPTEMEPLILKLLKNPESFCAFNISGNEKNQRSEITKEVFIKDEWY